MQKYIQEKYNFTNYQMKQLEYVYKTLLAEASKIIILLILFHNHTSACAFTILILSLLRTSAGGMHFRTYWGCLIATIIFFTLSIVILPGINISHVLRICLLCACGIINYKFAPITAPGHIELPEATIKHSKLKTIIVIELYTIIMYCTPNSTYMQLGFWIIMLHTLQLIFAKIQQTKEVP